MTRRALPAKGGFTLLEVLFSVAILGLVTGTLGGIAMQGLSVEGDALRRLEASLLADRLLADLEAAQATGAAQAPGTTEEEEGDFRVVVAVSAFDAERIGLSGLQPEGEEARPASPPALLGGGGRGVQAPLSMVEVRVSWLEGSFEREVTRTSFLLDLVAAESLLTPLVSEEASPDEEERQ